MEPSHFIKRQLGTVLKGVPLPVLPEKLAGTEYTMSHLEVSNLPG